jgi:hypothetical protein
MAGVNPIVMSLAAVMQKPKQEPILEASEAYHAIMMQKEEEEDKAGTATDGKSKGHAGDGKSGGSAARPGVPLAAATTAAAAGTPGEAANRIGGKGLFDPFNSGMSSLLLSAQETTDEPEPPKTDPLSDF